MTQVTILLIIDPKPSAVQVKALEAKYAELGMDARPSNTQYNAFALEIGTTLQQVYDLITIGNPMVSNEIKCVSRRYDASV